MILIKHPTSTAVQPKLSPKPGEDGEDATVVVLGGEQVELGEDLRDVSVDRALVHGQGTADGIVRTAFGEEREDVAFAWPEPCQLRGRGTPTQEVRDHVRVEDGASGGDGFECRHQLRDVEDTVLEEIAEALRVLLGQLRGEATFEGL